ncbi:phage regulatory CII family protein [Erwinia billingiae]|uniref:phage regulatory CII family protein n=1 Tax=Erwinia billingiae TaxID=182337 RepID=UPI0030D02D1C
MNRHNLTELATLMGTKPQILRNKFNPEQPHKLTCEEVLLITDLTEDASLLDSMLAQINCLPSVAVNEIVTSNLSTYALQAAAAVGSIAADAVKGGAVSSQRRMSLLEGVNACDLPPRIRYNLQLVMSVGFSSYFPFRQPAANSAGVR